MLSWIFTTAMVASLGFLAAAAFQAARHLGLDHAYLRLLGAVRALRPGPGERIPAPAVLPVANRKLRQLDRAVETSQRLYDGGD
jgi:hypothetical protein